MRPTPDTRSIDRRPRHIPQVQPLLFDFAACASPPIKPHFHGAIRQGPPARLRPFSAIATEYVVSKVFRSFRTKCRDSHPKNAQASIVSLKTFIFESILD